MLVRRPWANPSIRLRCRIRQLHRNNGVPLQSLFATPRSRFSSYANLRWQTPSGDTLLPEPDLRRSDIFPADELDAHKLPIRRVQKVQTGTKMKTIRKTRRTTSKHVLLEDASPLDRKALGQRAEVLILRDIDVDFGHKGKAAYDEAAAADAKERGEARDAIEASIASQNAVVGQEEVNAAINELKPSGGKVRRIFTAEKLAGLRKALNGFVAPQLRRFVMIAEDERRLEALKRIDDRIKASIDNEEASTRELPKSIWQEGITNIEERLPKGTLYLEPERLRKSDLIDYIIKRVWHVTTKEELDAVGEMEVEVKPWHLELVTKGFGTTVRESALDRIGIQRNVRIEVYRPDNIIRFTANRTDVTRAINDLQLELGNVGSSNFSLEPFKPMLERQGHQSILNVINKRDIEAIANVSNTSIEVLDDSLIIRATSEKNAASARRFLIDMLYLRARTETKLLTEATEQGFLYKNLMENALPYPNRQTNLGRWGSPVKRLGVNQGEEWETSTAKQDANFTAAEEGASSSVASRVASYLQSPMVEDIPDGENATKSEQPTEESLWNPKATTQISAGYGNVLHSFDSKPSGSSISAETIVESSKSPVFLNSIPGANPFIGGIASLGTQLKPGSYDRTPDTLLFRFVPFPWHHEDAAAASEDIPKFSLRLSLNDEGKVRYTGSGLTIAERNAYVLMPDRVTDVAFNRREMLWSQGAMRSQRIRDFVYRTQESIEMRGNIRVPPTITLNIPAWTIKNIERYPNLPKVYTELGEERVVKFSHVGTEHRQSLRLDFDNGRFRGTVSSVEAGRLGGRRNEVRLRVRKSPETAAQLESVLGKFVENGLRVAEWLDNAINLRLEVPRVNISRRQMKKYPELSKGKGPWELMSIWKGYGEDSDEEPQVATNASSVSRNEGNSLKSMPETGEVETREAEDEPKNADVAPWEEDGGVQDEAKAADFAPWEVEEKKEAANVAADFESDAVHSQATARQPEQDDESNSFQAQELALGVSENPSSDPESADAARTEGDDASHSALSDSASTSKEDGGQGREDQRQA